MLKELMDRDRAAKEYGLDPRELASLPSLMPLPPIEAVEDFAPDDFVPNVALPRFTDCETLTGQDALERWAAQTQRARKGNSVPNIREHSNANQRETQLQDVRCPHCGPEFAAEVER